MRYSGSGGKLVRAFWSVYQGILCNCITMGWVILAVTKLGKVALGLPKEVTLLGLTVNSSVAIVVVILAIVLVYSILSGLWGIVATDFFQYFIAFGGTVLLAYLSVKKVGGISALHEGLTESAEAGGDFLRIIPSFGTTSMVFFIGGLAVLWWASPWVDGGITVAQRTLAMKDERNAIIGRYWGNFAQYAMIIWPWVIVALCSIILFPASDNPDIAKDPESAYPKMMVTVLPVFFRGIMVAAFLAAFMSTIDTLLNSTASYIVNDLYKRFFVPNKSPKHYVLIARISIVVAAVIGGLIAVMSKSILELGFLLFEITAGIGLIFMLRWLWWRINAWSEISSYIAGIVAAICVNAKFGHMMLMKIALFFAPKSQSVTIQEFFTETIGTISGFPVRIGVAILISTTISLVVTFLTPPDDTEHLVHFYKKVKPPRGGWRRIHQIAGSFELEQDQVQFKWSNLFIGAIFFYSSFYALGKLPLGYIKAGTVSLIIAIISAIFFYKRIIVGKNSKADQ
jgi:SSS family solute:Na+ symporter